MPCVRVRVHSAWHQNRRWPERSLCLFCPLSCPPSILIKLSANTENTSSSIHQAPYLPSGQEYSCVHLALSLLSDLRTLRISSNASCSPEKRMNTPSVPCSSVHPGRVLLKCVSFSRTACLNMERSPGQRVLLLRLASSR